MSESHFVVWPRWIKTCLPEKEFDLCNPSAAVMFLSHREHTDLASLRFYVLLLMRKCSLPVFHLSFFMLRRVLHRLSWAWTSAGGPWITATAHWSLDVGGWVDVRLPKPKRNVLCLTLYISASCLLYYLAVLSELTAEGLISWFSTNHASWTIFNIWIIFDLSQGKP